MKKIIIAVFAAVLCSSACMAHGFRGGFHHGPRPFHHGFRHPHVYHHHHHGGFWGRGGCNFWPGFVGGVVGGVVGSAVAAPAPVVVSPAPVVTTTPVVTPAPVVTTTPVVQTVVTPTVIRY